MKYRFIRVEVTNEGTVSNILSRELEQGWKVVSHAANAGEYTFVLCKQKGA